MAKNLQLIFLGAPGSGKGTQASRLVEKMSYGHISTGDLLRSEIKKGSELGQRVDGILKAGKLVDRLTNRRTCTKCNTIYNLKTLPPKAEGVCDKCGGELLHMADDQEETIRKRMDVFQQEIEPMLGHYRGQDRLRDLDASSSADDIYNEIVQTIEKH